MAVKWVYEAGPLSFNFRVLLEPKGFLRIIMVFIAILAFSLTVDFSQRQNANSLTCNSDDNITRNTTFRSLEIEFSYPFTSGYFIAKYDPFDQFIENVTDTYTSCQGRRGFDTRSFAGFSQFFVAMGVMTFLYCIGVLVMYVIFINPNLFFAKWLIVFDFCASVLFAFLYLLADILWSAGIPGLETYIDSELARRGRVCLMCISNTRDIDSGSFVMPAMSVVFGWLLCFIWFSSIWFTYKDTHWHRDRTGPLAQNYAPGAAESAKTSSTEGGAQRPQDPASDSVEET